MDKRRLLGATLVLVASCSRTGSAPPSGSGGAPRPGASPEIDRVTPLPSPLPEVAARVSGQAISLANVRIFASKGGPVAPDKEPGAFREAMHHFIVRELLFQEAVRQGLKADDRMVEQKYDEAHLPYKDEKAWKTFLGQQGMNPDLLRAELRVQFTVQALIQEESSKMPGEVTDDELTKFYQNNPERFQTGERLKARHILIRVPPEVDPGRKEEFRTKAEGLLARVRSGEDFADLAQRFSDDAGSKGKGGVLAPFVRGQMAPAFERAAFGLKPGETSDVVETPFGFHVIKVDEKVASRNVPLEAVKNETRQYILMERRAAGMRAFVDGLRAKAKIETFL